VIHDIFSGMSHSPPNPRAWKHLARTYDRDFYVWTAEQAKLLRMGKLARADVRNLIEELETLGRSEVNSFHSAYEELLFHLLKWVFQSELRDRKNVDSLAASWGISILKQRNEISDLLKDNPSFKSRERAVIEESYARARKRAILEASLSGYSKAFPTKCPWHADQIKDDGFPEDLARAE
jgi:hypothetical protein